MLCKHSAHIFEGVCFAMGNLLLYCLQNNSSDSIDFSNEQLLSARIYSQRRLAGMNKVSCSSSREGEKVCRTEDCCLIVGDLQIMTC